MRNRYTGVIGAPAFLTDFLTDFLTNFLITI